MIYKRQNEFIKQHILPSEFFKSRLIDKKEMSSEIVYNFRCPVCGDSHKNKRKKRGYLVWKHNSEYRSGFRYVCFNCGEKSDFKTFLKKLNDFGLHLYDLWSKFIGFKETVDDIEDKSDTNKYIQLQHKMPLYVDEIESNKEVQEYVEKRCINKKYWNKKIYSFKGSLYDFIKRDRLDIFGKIDFAQTQFTPKNYLVLVMESFINGKIVPVGFALRDIKSNSNPKYYKIPVKDLNQPIFFSNIVDEELNIEDYPIFAIEGQIDALMFDNPTIAVMNSFLYNINKIKEIKDNPKVYIYDNDYKDNEFILQNIKKHNDKDMIVLWHLNKIPYKDANEMVMNGMKNLDEYIKPLIKSGLSKYIELKKL